MMRMMFQGAPHPLRMGVIFFCFVSHCRNQGEPFGPLSLRSVCGSKSSPGILVGPWFPRAWSGRWPCRQEFL